MSIHSSQQMPKVSTWIEVCLDKSYCWLSHPFKGPGAVANGLTGIKNTFVKSLFIFSWRFSVLTGKTSTGSRSTHFWAVPRQLFADVNSFPCFGVGNLLLMFVRAFWRHPLCECTCIRRFVGPVLLCIHGCIDG